MDVKDIDVASIYLAPEYLEAVKGGQKEVDVSGGKCDVFSLGMIII